MKQTESKPFIPITYSNESSNFTFNDIGDFFIWAAENQVSDITLQDEEMIFCEIHGKKHIVHGKRLNHSELSGIVTQIHSEGAISILNSGGEIDCSYTVKKNRNVTYRYRVNMKSIYVSGQKGFSLAIRTINTEPPLLESLNLPKEMLAAFKSKRGLILISGPTGSGKSTLLASIVAWRIGDPNAHIKVSTYEQPIEYTYDHVVRTTATISQVEVGSNLVGTFADGVRNSLRTRSDVVLVGEARDYDTIDACITAAMTGPLVYSTTHTNNVAEIIPRQINIFPPNERSAKLVDLVTNIKMLVTQMLVPSVDGKRIAVREYLIFNQEIVDLLLEAQIDGITQVMRRLVKQYGKTFLEDLTEKYTLGLISKEVFDEYR